MMIKAYRKYLSQLKTRYKKANKPQRIIILDEFTKTAGYDRSHAGKLLRSKYLHATKITHKPHRIYSKEDAETLKQVCELLGWICSKRMKPSLKLAVDELMKAG